MEYSTVFLLSLIKYFIVNFKMLGRRIVVRIARGCVGGGKRTRRRVRVYQLVAAQHFLS